ncbi:MAG TPA: carboxypeptidase M32 [Polyangiales bacterium]|nr:carboxypeptidase M32 [Polyangiales bacterium]
MSIQNLERQFRRIGHLQHVSAIMQWDEAVMMPLAAGPERAAALSTLGVVIHEHLTSPHLEEWIAGADRELQAGELDDRQSANLREIKRLVRRASALPAQLVEGLSSAQMRCEQAWRVQRENNDWQGFAPLLREVVMRKREAAAALSASLGVSAYDALLDEFEPFYSSAQIDQQFAKLRAFLPELIGQVIDHQRTRPFLTPRGPFPRAAQEKLGKLLMSAVGFDTARGRLDVSHHPFCGGVPADVRVTTRYDENDFISGMMGILHETGHAKYEENLPESLRNQPVGQARSMSVHESQSLLQEMQISRSREFLSFAASHIAQAFPEAASAQPEAFSVNNLARMYTRVARTKIRVNADEVTYPCHILLRYDLERRLIDSKLEVADIPEAWDAGMRELLNVSTGTDCRDGCMQDVHWAAGAFGYFPTYTLGAMIAAQLFAAAQKELPNLREQLALGQFEAINDFLKRKIWSSASLYEPEALLRHATGEALNPQYFEAHLRRRYLSDAR